MSKQKVMLIILLLIIIIIVAIAIIILQSSSVEELTVEEKNKILEEEFFASNPDYTEEIPKAEGVTKVKNQSIYYTIQNNITGYYVGIIEKNKEFLYNIVDKDFLEEKGITSENIVSDEESDVEDVYFKVEEMFEYNEDELSSYYVKGKKSDGLFDTNFTNVYFVVYTDDKNTTYAIKPSTSEEYNSLIQNGEDVAGKVIEKNTSNIYSLIIVSDETTIGNMLYAYKAMVKDDIEGSYELLDDKYKASRFNSFSDYEQYISQSEILQAMLKKYQVRTYDDYMEYVLEDQNGNVYIIKGYAVMDFDIMLDAYTVGTTDMVSEYNGYVDRLKANMNLERIISAINAKDYVYAYSKLDDTFRSTNFSTIEVYIQYVEEYWYEEMEVTYNDYEEISGIHVVTAKMTNIKNAQETMIEKFMVKLDSTTGYTYSFTID